jgi:S-adenosylmethionine decarboxylase
MKKNLESNRLKHFSKNLDYEYLLGFTFPKLSLKESNINGKGIYAEEKISVGGVVCPLFGIPYNIRKAKIDYPKHSYQISDDTAIETSNEPGFFNHSCNPNVFINQNWMFEAMKNIKNGEEILVDYATVDYFEYSFDCSCKSTNCRKRFDGKFSENIEFQKRMSKYFSPYLKERFHLIAPEVMRQRLLIDFTTKKDLTKEFIEQFLRNLVAELKLRSYGGPVVYETGGTGKLINQGFDAFIALVDSGISISTWRDSGLVSLYIHTCKEFSEEQTINFVKKCFSPTSINYKRV